MARDLPGNRRYQTLEQCIRSRVKKAMSEHLQTANLYVALTPEVNKLLQASAKAHQTNPSRIIALIIETCTGLLEDTMSDDLRDCIPAIRSVEKPPSPRQEADNPAEDLLALLLVRRDHRLAGPRRHFLISRHSKRLLGVVAGYHGLDMNRIVETLLLLGLSDPNIGQNQSVKADRRK